MVLKWHSAKYIYKKIAINQNERGQCNIVCRDVAKPFDKVWHEGLKYKILHVGLPGIIEKILCNFLDDRSAVILKRGIISERFNLKSGIPQGSILSPTLFIYYTSDLSRPGPGGTDVMFAVKAPLANSRINWVYDSPPSQSHHMAPSQNPPKSNNKVLRNNDNVLRSRPIAQSSDVRMRSPLGNISRSVWHDSTLSFHSNNCSPVPRNHATDRQTDTPKINSVSPS